MNPMGNEMADNEESNERQNEHAKQLAVGTFRHNVQEAHRAYYEWVRTCLTVSSGSLALLISLKGSYVPVQPNGRCC